MNTVCGTCGQTLEIGDYPFCPHGRPYNKQAKNFDPIIVHQDAVTGEYSFPPSSSDPAPPGHKTHVITNMREAERLTRDVNARERSKVVDKMENNRLYFEEQTKQRRDNIDSIIASRGLSGPARRLMDIARQRTDDKRNRKYSSARSLEPNFHIQALEFNVSNRQPHAGPQTGWKDRKS